MFGAAKLLAAPLPAGSPLPVPVPVQSAAVETAIVPVTFAVDAAIPD